MESAEIYKKALEMALTSWCPIYRMDRESLNNAVEHLVKKVKIEIGEGK